MTSQKKAIKSNNDKGKKKQIRKSPPKRGKKVWRIFRFSDRFELPENMRKCRKTALEFTRDFVGDAGGDDAVGYHRQFALLENGDGVEFCKLYGVYRLLVNMAGKQSRAFRGYLLDAKNQPLSDGQIGRLLKIEAKEMSKFLRRFASVDLLERVELPEFDLSVNEPPTENCDNKGQKSKEKGKKRGSGDHGRKRAENSTKGRPLAEKSAQGRKPLKERGNISNEIIGNDKKVNININGNGSIDYSNTLKAQSKTKNKSTSTRCSKKHAAPAPTTTPPIMSRTSDAGGSGTIKFPAPPGSVNHKRYPERIGDIVSKIAHRYDVDANQFSYDIYQSLDIPFVPDSAQGHRERGCFASIWHKAKLSGLPPPELDELRGRAVDEARKLVKRRSKCGNISAVWCTIFKRLLNAKCSKNRCKAM